MNAELIASSCVYHYRSKDVGQCTYLLYFHDMIYLGIRLSPGWLFKST